MSLDCPQNSESGQSEAIPDPAPPAAVTRTRQRLAEWRGLLVLIGIISLAAGIGQTSPGHAMLRAAGLFKQPATYTSLAFEDPQALGKTLPSPRAAIPVSFVIKNVGDTSRDYRWSVQVVQEKKANRIADGNVTITSGGQAVITRSAVISCSGGQARIVVSLADPAEFIDAVSACQSGQRRES